MDAGGLTAINAHLRITRVMEALLPDRGPSYAQLRFHRPGNAQMRIDGLPRVFFPPFQGTSQPEGRGASGSGKWEAQTPAKSAGQERRNAQSVKRPLPAGAAKEYAPFGHLLTAGALLRRLRRHAGRTTLLKCRF